MTERDRPTRARAQALEAWAGWLQQRRLMETLERLGGSGSSVQLARFKTEMDFEEFVDRCRALNG